MGLRQRRGQRVLVLVEWHRTARVLARDRQTRAHAVSLLSSSPATTTGGRAWAQACVRAWYQLRARRRVSRSIACWAARFVGALDETVLEASLARWRALSAARVRGRALAPRVAGDARGVGSAARDYYLQMTIETAGGEMRVKSFEPGSACEGALRIGDLILSIDGKQPRDPAHLREICRGPPGTIVAIRYLMFLF